ncbi:tumor protein p53-inducible nuclear protein 2 isoform X3 [Haplochromis burtoni]|uniref:Tumor protein p53 inducible nuclear protein 2 n=1 Tax=Haplochromis burtoni TaxID=8153 RepID=A0A3Q3CK36_HAPBU|nr:tumor protein p53-inducible nuclear protein 2 isoform X3 [Haplochromis burtoni]
MFQRLSNLLFGEVEEVAAELKGTNPCVTEADEEGWMIVNLPEESDCMMQVDDESGIPLIAQSFPENNLSNRQDARTRTECPAPVPHPPHKRRRTHKGRPQEGATAEASPMEDLLIEHPSMSVYVSPSNLSMVSNSNLSAVAEESMVSLGGSVRAAEPASVPATHGTMPTRVSRGAAAQAGALAKVTQVARVQRSKARVERRHLGRNRIQRQNRTREQIPRHAAHTRNTFLHQPSKRNFCH